MQKKEGDEAYMSDLDLIFDALENPKKYTDDAAKLDKRIKELNLIDLAKKDKQPHEYMCLKYYKDFKKAAGCLFMSVAYSMNLRTLVQYRDSRNCWQQCVLWKYRQTSSFRILIS